jgi:hypothetical protein
VAIPIYQTVSLSTWVNKGKRKGQGVISPGPRLFLPQYLVCARSFLALLLFAASS